MKKVTCVICAEEMCINNWRERPYTMNAALNVFLAIVATFANVLVFGAVRHNTSLHLPSKLLLCSLILTDLGVALVVQPQFVTFLITKVKDLSAISCSCINSLLMCFAVDNGSNKSGPLHRFVFPSEV